MSEEGDVEMTSAERDRYRRAGDARPVEVHGYGNGAKKNAIVNTVASVATTFASFGLVFAVIWWGSKIDTRQAVTIDEIAEIRAEQEVARTERVEMTKAQVRMMELYLRVSETLDRTAARGDDTRDIVIELKAIEDERRRVNGEVEE